MSFRMPRGKARIAAIALVALTALLVGFQGASTLLTVTELGAHSSKGPAPKTHASLVPQPPLAAVKPNEPAATPMPAPRASEPAADQPAPLSAAAVTPDVTPMPTVPNNELGVAAAAKAHAQAEMDMMGEQGEQIAPQREPRRRYRAPRPELHKVY